MTLKKQFTLSIETENDAFQPDPKSEVVRLLIATAAHLEAGNSSGRLMDMNGNKVGAFMFMWTD